jgi:hypothetical protein
MMRLRYFVVYPAVYGCFCISMHVFIQMPLNGLIFVNMEKYYAKEKRGKPERADRRH